MKYIKILCLISILVLCFSACSKAATEENQDTNTAESTDSAASSNKKGNNKKQTIVKDIKDIKPKNDSVLLSSENAKSLTSSTISTEEHPISQMKAIDEALQQEVESGNYTFEEPLVVLDPYQNSPLTAVALFQTSEKAKVRVTVPGVKKTDNVSGVTVLGTNHRVPIIGLYAGKENKVLLELLDSKGKVLKKTEVSVTTDVLPESMKNIVKKEVSKETSAYNLTYVSGQATPHAFAYDRSGTVRWYITMPVGGYGIIPLSQNRFSFQAKDLLTPTKEKPHTVELYEMDYLGRIHMVYYVENGFHHEVAEKTPGGNLIVLSNSIDEYVEDRVIELDRKTGEVVKQVDMLEVFGDVYNDMIDWAHLNSAQYDPSDNSMILSPRNVHSGIKIDWKTNELKWILSDPRFWEGTPFEDKVLKGSGNIVWHYQQHTVYQLDEDIDNNPKTKHVMMFDNHWHKTRKVSFFDNRPESFIPLYTIDEEKMTVTQDHLYKGVKSKITSNFNFDFENKRVFSMGGVLDPKINGRNGMIYEYDYKTEKVLNQYSFRYTFYRAYEMNIDYEDLSKPLDIPSNYKKGRLRAPTETSKIIALPKEILPKDIKFLIRDDILYIKAKDHSIKYIEFLSDDQSYIYDLTYTKGSKEYEKVSYFTAIPFQSIKNGTYKIAINYNDTWYNANHEVTVADK